MPEKVRRPRISPELAERIDAVRGDVPFERWVRRALEMSLEDLNPADDPLAASVPRQAPKAQPSFVEPPPLAPESRAVVGEQWPPPEPEDF